DPRRLVLPAREILGYGLPLAIASDAVIALRGMIVMVLLERLANTSQVADLRAFQQISGLNTIVLQSMKLLFLPVASRHLARGEHRESSALCWPATVWPSVTTFPLFIPCLVMPREMTWLIFGKKYVDAANVLVVLAIGEYVNAALGLNTYTLRVYERVRHVIWTTIVSSVAGIAVAG